MVIVMNKYKVYIMMDTLALPFILSSCKCDVEYIHDTLFQTTLSNYGQSDNAQYIIALNQLNIDSIISKLKELKMKRNLLNSLITNTTARIDRSESIESFGNNMRRTNSTIRNVQSSGNLFFPMDDFL